MPICGRFLPFFVREWAGVCVCCRRWSKLNDLWTIKKIFRRCSDDQIGPDQSRSSLSDKPGKAMNPQAVLGLKVAMQIPCAIVQQNVITLENMLGRRSRETMP